MAARVTVSGTVQGVGYRAWTCRQARALGLRGWVRNRRDGSVEMLLIGEEAAVAAMIEDAREGPHLATVDTLTHREAADDGSTGFTQAPTA